ncbi:MAG: hypothetical protein M5U27_12280 [Gaiella sp.]|nr:hypothetical protein [Gaiella sp.]
MSEKERSRKGEAFSIRLSAATDRYVEAEAARRKRSKSAIVEALTEEAARTHRFPGIGFKGEDYDRRAWVVGSHLDVWQLIELLHGYGEDEERLQADFDQLTTHHLRVARAYAQAYPDEIEEALAENALSAEDVRALFPLVEIADA